MKQLLVLMSALLLSGAALGQDSVSLPAGTTLKVKLENNLATLSNQRGDPFSARVTEAVLLGELTVSRLLDAVRQPRPHGRAGRKEAKR